MPKTTFTAADFLRSRALPSPSREVERELIARAQAGDKDATDRVVRHFIKLAMSCARSVYVRGSYGLDIEDLIQEGAMGISRALQDFDLETTNRFSTYASWWIKAYINRTAKKARERAVKTFSLDEPAHCDASGAADETHLDNLVDDGELADERFRRAAGSAAVRKRINGIRKTLTPLGRDVLDLRLMPVDEPLTLAEIARPHGYSREYARLTEVRIRKMLLFGLDRDKLEDAAA